MRSKSRVSLPQRGFDMIVKGRFAALWLAIATAAAAQQPRFLTFAEARQVLSAFGRTDDAPAWDAWIRQQDRDVRERVDRGVEDSISNLVLYGQSFTGLPRIDAAEATISASGELIPAARTRVHAAASALARPGANERLQFAHDFLTRKGVQPKDVEALLAVNLERFAREQRGYQERLRSTAGRGDAGLDLFVRSNLFESRGLSSDTSLLPNYALEETLAAMLRRGAASRSQVGSIAVIGPGLDFTDKRDGYDFYPVQTIQPFAMLEAVIRLGLAAPGVPRLVAFDLNPAVNAHIRQLAERASAGKPYVLHLPRDLSADWTPQAAAYWEHFGDRIGSPVEPAAAPAGIAVRAVAVQPRLAARVEARDLNVVGQVMDGEKFDLVVATNILVYYDRFQQSLALAGIARMLNPQGIFLSNTVLPAERPADLEYLGRRSLSYSASGAYGDDIVAYRKK
jgi:hypothetical protein